MNYKELKGYLIAIDLDNTVITGFDTRDTESFKILKELAKNNYVVIATGRPWRSSCYFYRDLELNTPIINYNGAYVHHPFDSSFKETMISIGKEKLCKFIKDNESILVNAFCEIKDDIYLFKETDVILPYLHQDGGILHIGDLGEILPENPNGAILFTKPGSEDILQNYVDNEYKEVLLRHWFTNDTLVSELYNPLTSKAQALEKICKYYNIDKEKTIAFGDGHNDIEMLEFCNIAVAMENSHPDLLKVCTHVTKTVHESGVAHFFKTHIF